MRDRPFNDRNSEDSSSIATPLDGSFDILDEEEAEEAQRYSGTLPGSFESHTRPSNIGSRASIDEFGSLSAGMSCHVLLFIVHCPSARWRGCSIDTIILTENLRL